MGILSTCPLRDLPPGAVLIEAGQPNHTVYLLLSGQLSIHLKESTDPITVLEAGEIVGEMSVIDGQPTSARVVAVDSCSLAVLDERTFWSLLETSHTVTLNLLFILSRRLRHGNSVIEVSLLGKLAKKELEEFQPREVRDSSISLAEDSPDQALALYETARAFVVESIQRVADGQGLDLQRSQELVQHLIDSMGQDSSLLLLATDRKQPFAVSTHSVNVTILSLRVAKALDYDAEGRKQVGQAALWHEIGVAWLPATLRRQPGRLSSQVRQRPVYGADILRKAYPDLEWLAETVGQVYERDDGSGFPMGLEGEEIRQEAEVVGIADVLEACIHDRPNRKALTGYRLIHELTRGETNVFSHNIVKALVKAFSLYPYNEYVILNTDEVAQVVEVNSANLMRPVVRILYDSEGKPLDQPRELDLAENPLLYIVKPIAYHALPVAI